MKKDIKPTYDPVLLNFIESIDSDDPLAINKKIGILRVYLRNLRKKEPPTDSDEVLQRQQLKNIYKEELDDLEKKLDAKSMNERRLKYQGENYWHTAIELYQSGIYGSREAVYNCMDKRMKNLGILHDRTIGSFKTTLPKKIRESVNNRE